MLFVRHTPIEGAADVPILAATSTRASRCAGAGRRSAPESVVEVL